MRHNKYAAWNATFLLTRLPLQTCFICMAWAGLEKNQNRILLIYNQKSC